MRKEIKNTREKRARRVARIRNVIRKSGRLRLSVFASNKKFYAQLIDDTKGETVMAASESEIVTDKVITKLQKAEELGRVFAKKAIEKKIKGVVFDKGRYKYHGRVKAFAEAARKEGLNF